MGVIKLDEPKSPDSDFAYLDKDGEVYLTASGLRDFLELGLLKNFQLRSFFGIRVQYYSHNGEASPDWRQHVHGSEIDMAKVGFHKRNFVLWGDIVDLGKRSYRPYIILAGLDSSTQTEALQAKGEVLNILEMLRLYVQDNKKFVNSETERCELKDRLEEILTDLKNCPSLKISPHVSTDLKWTAAVSRETV